MGETALQITRPEAEMWKEPYPLEEREREGG